eukprot:CAMPEP_0178391094 /NCGR_PEP_ID=MMETSP0689_2-20121128/10985_1 /TAXON_ID=160604 /ORGANISM="Amphidinium massartii, Strain CS-259" /LENGTH=39 /DNA_ID= /DNA_START= /DNA_END= /DNA_ORIENTATION=
MSLLEGTTDEPLGVGRPSTAAISLAAVVLRRTLMSPSTS